MLVAKYKRSESDDESERGSGNDKPKPTVVPATAQKEEQTSSSSENVSFIASKSLSVAPVVPDYKLTVRKVENYRIELHQPHQNCEKTL